MEDFFLELLVIGGVVVGVAFGIILLISLFAIWHHAYHVSRKLSTIIELLGSINDKV